MLKEEGGRDKEKGGEKERVRERESDQPKKK
jgi:hypothetical protein